MALGALIIKEILGISDRETVEQIKENPYLQYFIGMESYSSKAAFNASMMVHFRKKIGMKLTNKINKEMVKKNGESSVRKKENEGKLLLDATCTPADIKYPTDIGIVNEAREKTEKIIDKLYEEIKEKRKEKPRTYREVARKDYLAIVKKRRVSKKERRKGIKKQLQYIKRNLSHIEKMVEEGARIEKLTKKEQDLLITIKKVYEQQLEMYEKNTDRVANRIVSVTQPHVRPIVRGKAGKAVEFGAKISASSVNGYVFLDKLSWDNYNESGDLKEQIEDVKWLAQGTIYPDVIESVSVKGPSATIKSHHNVGGLPDYMKLQIVEPLRMLFKDEVRRVGATLGIDPELLGRHPFPGPGLSIRILGDITPEKVQILQDVDSVFIEGLKSWGLYDKVFVEPLQVQYF